MGVARVVADGEDTKYGFTMRRRRPVDFMRTWLFVGVAMLALSGLMMGVGLILDFITLDMQLTHEQRLSTVHSLKVIEYTALGLQLVGAWVTWRGFARSKHPRLPKYAAVVVACDIGSFLVTCAFLISHSVWAWKEFRSLAW